MTAPLVVCIKPVWRTDVHLRLDAAGRGVRAEESLAQTNPADLSALQAALSLRDAAPAGERPPVLALTVGPPSAETVLRDALAGGADEVLRLWGADWPESQRARIEGTADLTAFYARAAADAVLPRRPALLLVGERSGDAGHECFGAYLAHALGAAYAHRAVSLAREAERWRATVKLERGYQQEVHLDAPAVVTVAAQLPRPGYAGMPAWLAARRAEVPLQTVAGALPAAGGTTLRAPVPRVKRYRTPPAELGAEERIQAMVSFGGGEGGAVIAGEPPEQQAGAILKLLRERGYLDAPDA